MPETPIVYDDVEVLDDDALGFVCRIGNERVFVGKYVPIDGTNLRRKGDRGRLALPRWFVEQQGLPLARHLSDSEVYEWFALTRVRIAAARERVASAGMAKPATDEAVVQLATRLPASLLQRVKIFCIGRDQTMMDFITDALREKLGRAGRRHD